MARKYYPAQGGYIRDRETGELYPRQVEQQPLNPEDLELERYLLDEVEKNPDYQFAKILAPMLQEPVSWAVDTTDALVQGRLALRSQADRRLRDELVKQGLSTVNEDVVAARARLAEITAEQQYVQVNIRDAAADWLVNSGANMWPCITHTASRVDAPVCAGALMPAYFAWQYRLLRDDVLQSTTVPSQRLMSDVLLILDTDKEIFGAPWAQGLIYTALRKVLTSLPTDTHTAMCGAWAWPSTWSSEMFGSVAARMLSL